MLYTIERKIEVQAPKEALFAWHARRGAFERLIPPWCKMQILEQHGTIKDGDGVILKTWHGPIPITWQFEHYGYVEGTQFAEKQVRGLLRSFRHEHRFYSLGENRSSLVDHIEYEPPIGFMQGWIQREIERLIAYRHELVRQDVEYHEHYSKRSLKILVSGASGTIGSALVPFLLAGGHDVHCLQRVDPSRAYFWYPEQGVLQGSLEGFDAVINLAGYPIVQGRWNEAYKMKIRQSRLQSTKLLVDSMQKCKVAPKIFVSASAIGYYGNCRDEVVDEHRPQGSGFLASVCQEWESQALLAEEFGVRVAIPRIGLVLTPRGGALGKMLPAFRLGLGGKIGSGNQWISWISIDDLITAIHYAMVSDSVSGPFNAVTPNPVTNKEFTKILASVVHRLAIFPIPASALRLALGELADEALLSSVKVHPATLLESNFPYRHKTLPVALSYLLG